MIQDEFGRVHNYLRISLTDNCNLRCFYCMPEEGVEFLKRSEVLSFEEMERMIRVMADMGIDKVRITGGEPFLRKGLMQFLRAIRAVEGIKEIHITTNGTLTFPHLAAGSACDIRSAA